MSYGGIDGNKLASNKRKYDRFPSDILGKLVSINKHNKSVDVEEIVRIVNVSTGGVSMISPSIDIELDDVIYMNLVIKDDIFDEVKLKVVWKEERGDESIVGAKFVDIAGRLFTAIYFLDSGLSIGI